MATQNPNWFAKPRFTPLSEVDDSAEHVSGRLYRFAPGWYAMTNAAFGGTEDDPGIAAVMWARTTGVAEHVIDSLSGPAVEHSGDMVADTADLGLGVAPVTVAVVVEEAHRVGRPARTSREVRFPTGEFINNKISVGSVEYVLLDPDPGDDTVVDAVLFNLD